MNYTGIPVWLQLLNDVVVGASAAAGFFGIMKVDAWRKRKAAQGKGAARG